MHFRSSCYQKISLEDHLAFTLNMAAEPICRGSLTDVSIQVQVIEEDLGAANLVCEVGVSKDGSTIFCEHAWHSEWEDSILAALLFILAAIFASFEH